MMFKNYLLVALRNISNNKLFSAINIAGLAIGLSACFLIWQYVWFESNYDSFHANADRLYRVNYNLMRGEETARESAMNYPATGYVMKTDLPEVAEYCRIVKTSLFTSDLGKYFANALEFSWQESSGNLVAFNEENVWFADASVLTMFSFPLIAGKDDALKEPNSIVMTKRIAAKYFGDQDALGQEIRLNRDMLFKVTGVFLLRIIFSAARRHKQDEVNKQERENATISLLSVDFRGASCESFQYVGKVIRIDHDLM